jgi:hypothetical protein
LAADEPEHKDKTYKLRERRAMSIESTGSVRLDKEGHEIISDASPIKATVSSFPCFCCSCSPANLKGKRKRTTVEEDFEEYELSSSESSDSSLAVIDNTKKLEVKNKGARTSQGKYKRPQAGVRLADCDFLLILIISSLEKHEAPRKEECCQCKWG